jgi:hypothetical protein
MPVFSSASPSTSAMSDSLDWVMRLRRAFGSPNLNLVLRQQPRSDQRQFTAPCVGLQHRLADHNRAGA